MRISDWSSYVCSSDLELYRARRENRLAADDLYGLVRHPQYTGLFIALFGEGVVHWPTLFSVGLFPIIVAVFFSLARNEERRMLEQFGEEFGAYRQRVPMFVPQWSQWRQFARHSNTAAGQLGRAHV